MDTWSLEMYLEEEEEEEVEEVENEEEEAEDEEGEEGLAPLLEFPLKMTKSMASS